MNTSYVYKHTNILTGEFYIGSRYGNLRLNRNPESDLLVYICSSKTIKERIIKNRQEWQSEIIACFFKSIDAVIFEQTEIKSVWGNIKLLNKHYRISENNEIVFAQFGPKSAKHRKNISNGLKGKKKSNSHCVALSNANKGKKLSIESIQKRTNKIIGQKRTKAQRKNISDSLMGHFVSEETKIKIGIANSGKEHPKGKNSPCSKTIICINNNQIY